MTYRQKVMVGDAIVLPETMGTFVLEGIQSSANFEVKISVTPCAEH